MSDATPTRAGFVAILGAPNVGKSTLLNRLVGSKVSIVTPKAQTTRRRIIGITVTGKSQVMFVDTPGVFAPKRRLDRAMVKAAWSAAGDADLVLLVLNAHHGIEREADATLTGLANIGLPKLLAINKIDLVASEKLLPLIAEANRRHAFTATFLVSALTGDGCDDLLSDIARRLPTGPWLYPKDQLSDLSSRAMAAEVTREKLFLQLQQEIPYSATVETESWAESKDGSEVRIDQTIYVIRDSQKAIVLGKGGRQIKAIGESARKELEEILGARVHLFLFVKVREAWLDDPERFHQMGLDFER